MLLDFYLPCGFCAEDEVATGVSALGYGICIAIMFFTISDLLVLASHVCGTCGVGTDTPCPIVIPDIN